MKKIENAQKNKNIEILTFSIFRINCVENLGIINFITIIKIKI